MSKISNNPTVARWTQENRATEAKNQIGEGLRSIAVGVPAALGFNFGQIFDENKTPASFHSFKTIPVGLGLIGGGLDDVFSGLVNLIKA